ncbi:MAG: hypothetical protein FLDDKLPJ_02584 [Phycisphaerae bacterium]|nr:hypothetical protein [Phycisphaerae bacterium]
MRRLGIWLIGAGGYVGSMTALGLSAMRRGRVPSVGLVSDHEVFRRSGLIAFDEIVFGGHEVRRDGVGLVENCAEFSTVISPDLVRQCRADLQRWQRNIQPGTLQGDGRRSATGRSNARSNPDASGAAAVERLASDLLAFRSTHKLSNVVVINVARTEPVRPGVIKPASWDRLQKRLARRGPSPLPASSLYALAAIESGCAYINFTPSAGIDVSALRRRADERGMPYMGRDGKTGETLVKSVLAPLFTMRRLNVLSWLGYNLLGNPDGLALSDPRVRRAKEQTKDQTLRRLLGGSGRTSGDLTTRVGIDYVPSLGDRKLAWNFIHFEGFLGARMSLEFRWHGVDSLLAAPLVLDLARFTELELRRGAAGPMRHLAFFFKAPMQTREFALHRQWDALVSHVRTG